MAVSRSDIHRWLLDAADNAGADEEDQIDWLREQRKEYSERIKAGDWEITQESGEGGSSAQRRHVSDRDNHDAILGALRALGATDVGGGGGILQVQFGGILG
jgi:hypothetical protein